MSQAKKRATPDEGLLDKVGVAQLLAEAWGARRSGRLRVARGKTECWIQVAEGSPVSVETKGEADRFARSLESTGQIQLAERRKIEQFAAGTQPGERKRRFGAARQHQLAGLGNVLDEQGRVRKHVAIFVAGARVDRDRALKPGDEVFVFQALSGG